MELAVALDELPHAYAVALRLRLAGADTSAIAAQLELDPEAVAMVLELASAKLASLLEYDACR